MKPKVHIVLVNWNSWAETSSCLVSLESLQYANWKVIVVDNGSVDDSVWRIRQRFPWAEVILTGKNLGFPRGSNFGIRQALSEGTDYVWLLNNDALADPLALDGLVAKAESDPKLGAIGSTIYCSEYPTQLQAWGGGYVNFWLGCARHFIKEVPDAKVQYITGASMLIPARALKDVGLLDEALFLYWDDPEYCWRLKTHGWKIGVARDSKIWHKGASAWGGSARLDTFYSVSAVHFFSLYASTPWVPLWTGMSLRVAKRLLHGEWKRAQAIWAGFRQGLAGSTGPSSGPSQNDGKSQVADSEMASSCSALPNR